MITVSLTWSDGSGIDFDRVSENTAQEIFNVLYLANVPFTVRGATK